jgi:hypothetical protein
VTLRVRCRALTRVKLDLNPLDDLNQTHSFVIYSAVTYALTHYHRKLAHQSSSFTTNMAPLLVAGLDRGVSAQRQFVEWTRNRFQLVGTTLGYTSKLSI